MAIFQEIFSSLYIIALLASLFTFLFSTKLLLYPVIISVAQRKGLMDEPGERCSHVNKVPRLGGLGMFISFSLSIIVVAILVGFEHSEMNRLLSLIGSLIILVFIGIKDDLVWMSPLKKLIGQIIAAGNVIVLTDVRITSLEGLLGIGELPYFASILFSVFVFILVINATNLIDGIDGLSGVMALVTTATFGVFFLINEQYMMTLVSFVLIGSIVGFLKYNFSNTHKIFMGDCGSMFLGFLLAYQGIILLSIKNGISTFSISNAPIVFLAVLSYPLLDTLRVFIIRVKQKRSPFDPDRNHIHHRLLDIGLTHKQATLLISFYSSLVIGVALISGQLNINIQLLIIVCIGLLLYLSPFLGIFEKRIQLNPAYPRQDPIQDMELDKKNVVLVEKKKEPLNIKNDRPYVNPEFDLIPSEENKMESMGDKDSRKTKFMSKRAAAFSEAAKSKKQKKRT